MTTHKTKRTTVLGFAGICVAVTVTVCISWMLYQHTVGLLTANLRERLMAIAKTAAVQFDPEDLAALKSEPDWKKPAWPKVVRQLLSVRLNNENILFSYIVRKNQENPENLEFVSDSHSLNPYAPLDLNNDGNIDDADLLQWPGQPYEEPPVEALEAYESATTSRDLIYDQWGVEMVGYAPIRDSEGQTVAVMAVDMKVDDFVRKTRETFLPFLAFILALTGILLILAGTLIRIWNKQVKLLQEIDRQKDELLNTASHQLATPITSAKWYLEVLLDGDLGALTTKQKEHIITIRSVITHLSDLVNRVLDVSRIELGRIRVEKQEQDISALFREILDVIEPKAAAKGVKLTVGLPKGKPKGMLDRRLTRMVIENVLSNAVQYTPEDGEVRLCADVSRQSLFCEVSDTGIGIPKTEQGKIFGKLYRASNARDKILGNGFGLYIAKGAVESQGGKIRFESEEGKGTTFFIELPLTAQQ